MDFRFTPEQEALRKEFDDFFREEMKDAPPEWETPLEAYGSDACWEFHKQMAKKLAARGWISLPWPTEYGGQNASLMEQFVFGDVLGYHRGAGIDPLGVGILAPTLLVSGNDEQKMEHLPPIARADKFWCQCWSEPGAGSDLACLATRAARDGGDYIINGQKIWTTGAHRADWCNILARTNPDQKRSRGLSFFLVDMKTPGISMRPILSMDGSHGFNEVFFDDVRVPARNRVGEENQGWLASQAASNFERSMIAMFSLCRRELEELVGFCKEIELNGVGLAENPQIRFRLAQLAIEIDMGRAFSYFVIWSQIKGGLIVAAPLAASAKVLASELKQCLTDTGCQIMGLYGQVKKSRWAPLYGRFERNYQLCRGLTIGGGASEVMRNLVCSLGLGLPRGW
jgi:alkylation response protein AidB-like acyl-CoA dehydrogenase